MGASVDVSGKEKGKEKSRKGKEDADCVLFSFPVLFSFMRRRRLVAFSRHEQTPRHLLIELQADGTDYVVLQSGVEAAFGESWQVVLDILTTTYSKRTRQEILDDWPADHDKPDSTTLWRWLSRVVARGVVRYEGTGHPNDPFRYWLPA